MSKPDVSILCLIGLPASGKTHLASVIAEHKLGFSKVLIFCYDELIRWEMGKYAWKEERNNVLTKIEGEISLFINSKMSNERLLLVLDDNMYYRSMRYPFYRLARLHKIKYCQIYINTPLTVCLERNSTRFSPLPTHHILNMNEKLEVPFYYNGWEKNTLTVSGEENPYVHLDKIQVLIESSCVAKELEVKFTVAETQSRKHIADIALRRIISLLAKDMKANDENEIAAKVSKLILRKNEIMKLINDEKIALPWSQDPEIYILHFFPIMTE